MLQLSHVSKSHAAQTILEDVSFIINAGERARLLLARLVVSGVNCLLLDEPINHLDIPSLARFQSALDAFPGSVLIATHDRAFIDHFATGIWSPRDGTIRQFVDREEMQKP